jgi:CHAT domain-containing protein
VKEEGGYPSLVSHWSVDSQATAELITGFFKAIGRNVRAEDALAQAERRLMADADLSYQSSQRVTHARFREPVDPVRHRTAEMNHLQKHVMAGRSSRPPIASLVGSAEWVAGTSAGDDGREWVRHLKAPDALENRRRREAPVSVHQQGLVSHPYYWAAFSIVGGRTHPIASLVSRQAHDGAAPRRA